MRQTSAVPWLRPARSAVFAPFLARRRTTDARIGSASPWVMPVPLLCEERPEPSVTEPASSPSRSTPRLTLTACSGHVVTHRPQAEQLFASTTMLPAAPEVIAPVEHAR